jgi:hypothetical protein
MKRREFITLLGGAAAAWPFAARAQQPSKTAKIGILYPGLASALPSRALGFREVLQAAGYREPDNIELILRSANSDPTRIGPRRGEFALKIKTALPSQFHVEDRTGAATFDDQAIYRSRLSKLSRPAP